MWFDEKCQIFYKLQHSRVEIMRKYSHIIFTKFLLISSVHCAEMKMNHSFFHIVDSFQKCSLVGNTDFYVPPCFLQVPTWHFLICWGIAVYQCPHFRRLFSPKRKEFRTFPRETCLRNEKSILKSLNGRTDNLQCSKQPSKIFSKGLFRIKALYFKI